MRSVLTRCSNTSSKSLNLNTIFQLLKLKSMPCAWKLTPLLQEETQTIMLTDEYSENSASDMHSSDELMNEELGVSIGLSKSQSRRIDWVF